MLQKQKKNNRRWWKLKKARIFPPNRDINLGVYEFNADEHPMSIEMKSKECLSYQAIVFRCATEAQQKALL